MIIKRLNILSFIWLLSFPFVVQAEELFEGNIHAIVNLDGTVSYHIKNLEAREVHSEVKSFNKNEVLDAYRRQLHETVSAYELSDESNNVTGFFVTSKSANSFEPVNQAINSGYAARVVNLDSIPSNLSSVYDLTPKQGELPVILIPIGIGAVAAKISPILQKFTPISWSISKRISQDITLNKNDIIDNYRKRLQEKVSAYEVLDEGKKVAGFFVTSETGSSFEPLNKVTNSGYTAKAVNLDSIPNNLHSVFELTPNQGNLRGLWISSHSQKTSTTLQNFMPDSWSASAYSPVKTSERSTSSIPVPSEDILAGLRTTMLEQAISLACDSKIKPKDIKVSASLAASIGFIIGGEGSIAFEVTWDVEKLCKEQTG